MRIYFIPILLSLLLTTGADCQENKAAVKATSGKINISVFVYRDVNRNGIYDLADRPYAGQEVQLFRPNGGPSLGVSNISGFTNFKMSLNNPKYPIPVAGAYRVEIKKRKNWQVTSNNGKQDLIIRELPGSPAGLVAKKSLVPIGVAPKLFVEGLLGRKLRNSALTAISPEAKRTTVAVDSNGVYRFVARKGVWTLELKAANGEKLQRIVHVETVPVYVSQWQSESTYASRGKADTVTFDNLTTSDTLYEIPNDYGGLQWTNWIATHSKFYKGGGYVNNTTSGEYVAYNSSGHPASIHSNEAFDVVGFHIGVAWPQAERSPIRVRAFRGSEIQYEDIMMAKTAGPLFFAAHYKDITKIEFTTGQYWQVVLDDLIVNTPD